MGNLTKKDDAKSCYGTP